MDRGPRRERQRTRAQVGAAPSRAHSTKGKLRAAGLAAALLVMAFVAPAGSTDARSRARGGQQIFNNGFESGRFTDWSAVQLGGDGTAAVQSATVAEGRLAAELSESSNSGSRADLRKTFSSRYRHLTASGRFLVVNQGSGALPLFRFFDSRWRHVATIYRQNGAIRTAYGSRRVRTHGQLPLNRWGSIMVHVITNGVTSTIDVRLNGRLIYHTDKAHLGKAGITTLQIGNDVRAQPSVLVADAIQVRGADRLASPPVNTGLPAVAGLRVSGRRVSVAEGNWSGKQPMRRRYRWLRCDSRGAHCRPIAHETGRTYVVRAADVGRRLRVAVTVTNAVGRATATSVPTTIVEAPPANRTLPSVLGTPRDGQVVTVNRGSWSGTAPIDYGYQWLRCDTAGANCHSIPAANGGAYLATSADVGSTLRVDVTGTNAAGSATARSPGVRVVAAPPANTSTPSILGTPQDGQTVSADAGSWSGTPPIGYRYQWLRCDSGSLSCAQIDGATTATYKVVTDDVGSDLRVDVTATNSVGSVRARSQAVHAAASLPVSTVAPSIQGTPQDGQTITADPGTWNGTPPIDYGYQWVRCDSGGQNCAQITGATDDSYAVSAPDVGSTLRVDVTATNPGGSATARSAPVTAVAAPPVNTAPPKVNGAPQSGQNLNVTRGTWSGTAPIGYGYQWLRCDSGAQNCVSISGATGATYLVSAGDVGSTLRVDVTASNSAGSATARSNATAVIQQGSSPGAVALWHMDETSGTTMHDSAGTHDGTLSNVQVGLAGASGQAYGFNGSSSSVSVPSTGDLNPGAADVTVTIHIQTTGTPPAPPADWDLIRKGIYDTGASEFKMEFQRTGQASCGFEGTVGYSELIAGPAINDGQWHTVQCVKTSSSIKLVVDGQTFSQSVAIGSITNTSPVVLGAHPGSDWYHGALDEASLQIG